MAGPSPREVFLANMLGRAVVLAEGPRGSVLRPFGMAAWHGNAPKIICRPPGERIFNSQINSGASGSGVSQYLRIINPASYLSVEFGRLVHQVRSPRTLEI